MLVLTHAHPYRAATVLGALVLTEAPRYGGSAHTPAFHTAPAAVGILLILPGFWRLVTRSRKDTPTPSMAQRRHLAWRVWVTLLVAAALLAIATVAEAGIHLLAPLTLCTVGLLGTIVWTSTGMALAMLREDRTGPVPRLRWLTVTPGCLLGLVLTLLIFGDTWATLLVGCFSTGLGALLCDLWASVPQGSRTDS
jgi:hypothetical protein